MALLKKRFDSRLYIHLVLGVAVNGKILSATSDHQKNCDILHFLFGFRFKNTPLIRQKQNIKLSPLNLTVGIFFLLLFFKMKKIENISREMKI